MLRISVVLMAVWWLFQPVSAASMTLKVIPPDKLTKAIGFDITQIFIDGAFEANSPKQVAQAVSTVSSGRILFFLNSPGGNLEAGMQIGRLIRKAEGTTYIGSYHQPKEGEYGNSKPGFCLSACSLAFLGGVNRYINDESVYGVHRFSKNKEAAGDLDLAQVMSAVVTDYIVEMGVSSRLFNKMVEAGASEIRILHQSELKELSVVKDGIEAPEWSVEVIEGGTYLRGMQETSFGVGKLVFVCGDRGVMIQSVYDAGQRANEVAKMAHYNTFRIDDKNYPLDEGTRFINGGYINNLHSLPLQLIDKIVAAKSVGYAMQVTSEAPIFWGFSVDIGNESDRGKLRNYLNNCVQGIH